MIWPASEGDITEYVRRMQQDLFDTVAKARSLDELHMLNYSRKCLDTYQKRRLPLALGMKIG